MYEWVEPRLWTDRCFDLSAEWSVLIFSTFRQGASLFSYFGCVMFLGSWYKVPGDLFSSPCIEGSSGCALLCFVVFILLFSFREFVTGEITWRECRVKSKPKLSTGAEKSKFDEVRVVQENTEGCWDFGGERSDTSRSVTYSFFPYLPARVG